MLLARSAKGAAIVDLIKKVLSAPGVYVFGELLEMPSVKELLETPHKCYVQLLEVFAYGTLSDYAQNKGDFPELTAPQLAKLRHLTIAELAAHNKTIPYSHLVDALALSNIRELEDVIIQAFYANVIHGQLDQINKQLIVQGFIGRDIREGEIPEMIAKLESWGTNCSNVLAGLEAEMAGANERRKIKTESMQALESEVSALQDAMQQVASEDQKSTSFDPMETGPYKKGLRGSATRHF